VKKRGLKGQALIGTASSAAVRGMGFVLRLVVARLLGAEAAGVMELTGGAHMLALTPAAAGLPGAVSRLTAKAKENEQRDLILCAARQLAVRSALIMGGAFLLLSPLIARLLGDVRTLPGLAVFSPCILFIGVAGVYKGAAYGRGDPWPAALEEVSEQAVRVLATAALLMLLPALTIPYRAAMPALATVLGEGAGMALMLGMGGRLSSFRGDERLPGLRRQIRRLALPLMLNRLSHAGMRMLCGVIIPLRLMAAGLSQGEAVSRLGMLNGMVTPLMLLPGLFCGALATVGGPALARCETLRGQRRLMMKLGAGAGAAGYPCAVALYALAPWIARQFYRLPELSPLIRSLCPLAVILPLEQVIGGMLTGLGMQKKGLQASLLGAAITLMCTWILAANPHLHIYGAGYASILGHGTSLMAAVIFLIMREKGEQKPLPAKG